jgi:hypothetical protein
MNEKLNLLPLAQLFGKLLRIFLGAEVHLNPFFSR